MDIATRLIRLIPALAGILVAITLFWLLRPQDRELHEQGLAVGGIVLAVLATVAIFRYALRDAGTSSGTAPPTVAQADLDSGTRNRIAPFVLGIGTAGIVAIGLAVIVALNNGQSGQSKDAILSVFSTVVPVFSTWVGAVIAFYFSNESFRQAAESTGTFFGVKKDEPLASRMVPYDKITKLVLGEPFPASLSKAGNVPDDFEQIELKDVRGLFGDTVSRVIVFDKKHVPKVIVRKKLDDPDKTEITTVGQYLASEQNKVSSMNFMGLPANAMLEDAKRVQRLYGVPDIFLTDTGSIVEPAQGWVPDDKLA